MSNQTLPENHNLSSEKYIESLNKLDNTIEALGGISRMCWNSDVPAAEIAGTIQYLYSDLADIRQNLESLPR